MQHRLDNKGSALAGAIFFSVIAALGAVYLHAMVRKEQTTVSIVHAREELNEMVQNLMLILEDPNSCAQSGLINTQIANLAEPSTTALTMRLPGTPNSPFVASGLTKGLLKITEFSITRLNFLRNTGVNSLYVANFRLRVRPAIGWGGGETTREFFATLELNAERRIVGCEGAGTTGIVTSIQCDTYQQANGSGNDPHIGIVRPTCNIAQDPKSVESTCPQGAVVIACNPRCRTWWNQVMKSCAAKVTRNNTGCMVECRDTNGKVCGDNTGGEYGTSGSKPAGVYGWAQLNMRCLKL